MQIAVRLLALGALALAGIAVTLTLLRGGGERYELTAELRNASQLIGGEIVVVGGVRAGSVTEVALSADNRALVSFTVDEELAPLREGTIATVRSTSLAGIANRRLELTLPGDEAGEPIPDGGRLDESATVSEVDLDQLFNTLDERTVSDLKRILRGLERSGRGLSSPANRGLRYLNPLLSTSRRVLAQLNDDRDVLRELLVDGAALSSALAGRSVEISRLVHSLDLAMNAIGRQRAALSETFERLPDFMREANTTFVNLRAAAEDLEPLLAATDPLAERLGPFFLELRGTARRAVPALRDLDQIVHRPRKGGDLVELTQLTVPLVRVAVANGRPDCGENPESDYAVAADGDFDQGALGEATCVLRNALPVLAHFRPYTPELIGWFDDFSTTGTLDASGGIGRIAGTFNAFSVSSSNGLPELLSPIDLDEALGGGSGGAIDVGNTSRCPGSLERDPGDGSVPFTDGGRLNCDPSQMPVGP